MCELHTRDARYGFDRHKGYATAEHLSALETHGACSEHRRSFAPVAAHYGDADEDLPAALAL